MPNRIIIKRSSVAGKTPLAADLSAGELAINLNDKRLFSKDGSGNIVNITVDASHVTTGTLPVARVSGLAASATTDATNAGNISSGTLPSARLSGTYSISISGSASQFSSESQVSYGREKWESVTVGGDANTYYPVVFSNGYEDWRLFIRKQVHDLAQWDGTLTAEIEWHSSTWGGDAGYVELRRLYQNHANKFLADWAQSAGPNSFAIVWLRGGGRTYQWRTSRWVGAPTVYLTTTDLGNSNGSVTSKTTLITTGQHTALTSYNYNSYAPTLTGTGASGTWNITSATANALTSGNNYQVNSIGVGIAASGTAGSIGLNQSGVRSWAVTPTGGNLAITSGDSNGSITFNGSALQTLAALNAWAGSANITTIGTLASGTVPVARVSGLATSATTDTTNAANISSGTLPSARLTGSYAISVTGSSASCTGNAATATTTDNINGRAFLNRDSGNGLAQDAYTGNGVGYVTGVSLFSQTDGGLHASAYSNQWVHQIYGDFRTGQIAIRGRNNGTWQAWRSVLDSSNWSSYVSASALSLGSGNAVTFFSVSDSYGNLRTLPQNTQAGAYTLAASDTGRHINASNTITVPSGTFSAGQLVTVYNNTAGNINVNVSGVTMYQAGTANSGSRTLAQRGVATILCVAANTFVISGTGLT